MSERVDALEFKVAHLERALRLYAEGGAREAYAAAQEALDAATSAVTSTGDRPVASISTSPRSMPASSARPSARSRV